MNGIELNEIRIPKRNVSFLFFSSACLSAVLQAHRERERWMDETISRQLCCFITLKYHSGSNSINGELVFIQLFHRLRYFFFFRSRRATRRQRDQWVTFVITHMTRYGHSRKKKQSNMNVFENLKWQKSWSRENLERGPKQWAAREILSQLKIYDNDSGLISSRSCVFVRWQKLAGAITRLGIWMEPSTREKFV